ncbi:MAG: type II toxin-antitoxin system HicA family toxin [Candidatus Sungbacteria bacterium]|nr:type II toxin-antitoxin system HicA family toxin [Candidatus Sungbacteria bacterium]
MSRRFPALTPRKVLQALSRAGFFTHHTTGSHYILKHPNKGNLRVSLAYHNKILKRKTLASIIEQAGLTPKEFLTFL